MNQMRQKGVKIKIRKNSEEKTNNSSSKARKLSFKWNK